jgi:hypothetical protein
VDGIVQRLGRIVRVVGLARAARAGVVRHHAPALRGLVIDVGGQHEGMARAFGGEHLDALQHVVHGAGQRLDLAHPRRLAWIAPLPNICSKAARMATAPTSRGPPGCTQNTSSSSAQQAISASMSPRCSAS